MSYYKDSSIRGVMSWTWRRRSWGRMAVVFTGLAALGAYLVPRSTAAASTRAARR
jgi:hypothetical protein